MRTILSLTPLCLLLLACASAGLPGQSGEPGNLAAALEPFVERQGVDVAIAYRHLGTGATYFSHEDEPFHAASTMKVPVMMALFQAVDAGELRLTEPLAVRNQFQSFADGSAFTLDPKADGDPDFYQAVGRTRPLEELVRRLIVRRSNLATTLLL